MELHQTKQLLNGEVNRDDPLGYLSDVLMCAKELLSLPDNDFLWSWWESSNAAISEIELLINITQKGEIPEASSVKTLFAPTGPLQEVSLSSGWGDVFIRLAGKYDEVEHLLWQ